MTQSVAPAPWPSGCAVLIPVFNHVATVGAVVTGMRLAGATHILVIDDGSTDGSGAAAQAAGCDELLTLSPNQGKGRALHLGLNHLAAAGYSCALTIDADMQHPPAEGARLAHAAMVAPGDLWLGVRDMTGAPFASRFGRWWTSLWTWVCCGTWPHDNQTGLRVYPLPAMTRLPITAGRYAYEVESLIRAVWGGVRVARLAVAVRYPADRISHFHKVKDNLRTAWAFTRLVARSLVPWPHARSDGQSTWKTTFRDGLTPGPCAAAAGLGAAIGVSPLVGFHWLLTAWLALKLRLNPAVALIASNVSFGPLLAVWYGLEIGIGNWLRGGSWAEFSDHMQHLNQAIIEHGPITALSPFLGDWLLGCLPVMAGAGLVSAGFAGALAAFGRRRG
jgi:uncharacterized protein (DUF2062 family)